MKGTLLKASLAAGIASVGVAASVMPAQAIAITPTTTNCDFAGAAFCSQVFGGNDSETNLNNLTGEPSPYNGITWSFLSKINEPNTTPDEGALGTFSLTYDNLTRRSGTWTVASQFAGQYFVLAMKAGPNFAYNYFDGSVLSGRWDTERFINRGGQQAGLSHVTMYIPTPALLPGLVAMGVGMIRKQKAAQMAEAETEA